MNIIASDGRNEVIINVLKGGLLTEAQQDKVEHLDSDTVVFRGKQGRIIKHRVVCYHGERDYYYLETGQKLHRDRKRYSSYSFIELTKLRFAKSIGMTIDDIVKQNYIPNRTRSSITAACKKYNVNLKTRLVIFRGDRSEYFVCDECVKLRHEAPFRKDGKKTCNECLNSPCGKPSAEEYFDSLHNVSNCGWDL